MKLSLGEEEEERGSQEGWAIVHRGCIFVRLALVAIVRRKGEKKREEGKGKEKKSRSWPHGAAVPTPRILHPPWGSR